MQKFKISKGVLLASLLIIFISMSIPTAIFIIFSKNKNSTKNIDVATQKPVPSQVAKTDKLPNQKEVYITFYGWSDNDPPGKEIAYPKSEQITSVHEEAGGTGTFDDPITAASDPTIYPPGTKFYIPRIKKYALIEDWCAGCIGHNQVDVWIGGDGKFEQNLLKCEDDLTINSEFIELNPPKNRPLNNKLLFDSLQGICLSIL